MRYARALLSAMPAIAMAAAVATSAQARDLRHAIGYPPNSIGSNAADMYAEALSEFSEGKLKAKVYPLSLLNFLETSEGLRDGIADSGVILLPYFQAEFPSANMIAELSMLPELTGISPDDAGMAFGGAFSEYLFNHCPECLSEFGKQNQVFIGASASSPYYLLCNKPVFSMEQAQGKRLRAGGAQWSRWASAVGATSVTMSVNEIYDGLSQGVVDCTIQSAPELTIFKLMEVSSHITLAAPGGVFAGTNNMNKETWGRLSEDERRAVLRASAVTNGQITWMYREGAMRNLETARKDDKIEVREADDSLVQASRKFIEADSVAVPESYRQRYGVTRADEMVKTFQPILQKWAGLVGDVKSGQDLVDLYWNEVFSKVDVKTFGM